MIPAVVWIVIGLPRHKIRVVVHPASCACGGSAIILSVSLCAFRLAVEFRSILLVHLDGLLAATNQRQAGQQQRRLYLVRPLHGHGTRQAAVIIPAASEHALRKIPAASLPCSTWPAIPPMVKWTPT